MNNEIRKYIIYLLSVAISKDSTQRNKRNIQLISQLANNENTLTTTLTEMLLNDKILHSEIQIKNYVWFHADQTLDRRNGDIVTYTKAVDAEQLIAKFNSCVEYQLIHVKKCNIIINFYNPPDCHAEKFINPFSELRTKLIEIGNSVPNILFTGDLNFPIIDRKMETADSGTHENQVQANAFLQFAQEQCLWQYIEEPMKKNNILNVFFTNNNQLTQQIIITKTSMSDHNIIHIEKSIKIVEKKQNPPIQHLPLNLLETCSAKENTKYPETEGLWWEKDQHCERNIEGNKSSNQRNCTKSDWRNWKQLNNFNKYKHKSKWNKNYCCYQAKPKIFLKNNSMIRVVLYTLSGCIGKVVVVVVPRLVCPSKPTPLRKSKQLAEECHSSSGLLMSCCALMCLSVGQWVIMCVRLWVLVLQWVQTSLTESSIVFR